MKRLFQKYPYFLMIALAAVVVAGRNSAVAGTASENNFARQIVTAALTIVSGNALDFGTAEQGAPAKSVAATDPEAATFTVTSQAGTAYSITLPASGTVKMTKSGGTAGVATQEIEVSSFDSIPSSNSSIPVGGSEILKVGATRAALLANQETGTYEGSFTVSVVY